MQPRLSVRRRRGRGKPRCRRAPTRLRTPRNRLQRTQAVAQASRLLRKKQAGRLRYFPAPSPPGSARAGSGGAALRRDPANGPRAACHVGVNPPRVLSRFCDGAPVPREGESQACGAGAAGARGWPARWGGRCHTPVTEAAVGDRRHARARRVTPNFRRGMNMMGEWHLREAHARVRARARNFSAAGSRMASAVRKRAHANRASRLR